MVRFINRAPLDQDEDWRKTEMFADVLQRAQVFAKTIGTDIDRRVFEDCLEYWTQTFPKVTDATRSGFITSFTSMADVLSGRGIYEMLGTDTNLTPQMILSGKIVVLDIPLKGNIQGGLMVQAMFKLLFQQAVERRADKGESLVGNPAGKPKTENSPVESTVTQNTPRAIVATKPPIEPTTSPNTPQAAAEPSAIVRSTFNQNPPQDVVGAKQSTATQNTPPALPESSQGKLA